MSKNSKRTFVIDIDSDKKPVSLNGVILYGINPYDFDYSLIVSSNIRSVDILDNSNISVESIIFIKSQKRLEITLKNLNDNKVYASAKLTNLTIDKEQKEIWSEQIEILPNSISTLKIKLSELLVDDAIIEEFIENNEMVFGKIFYGSQVEYAFKEISFEKKLKISKEIKEALIVISIVIVLFIVLLVMIYLIYFKEGLFFCQRCGGHYKLKGRKKKYCPRCGNNLIKK
jgi:hypothetical protein